MAFFLADFFFRVVFFLAVLFLADFFFRVVFFLVIFSWPSSFSHLQVEEEGGSSAPRTTRQQKPP